VKLIDTSEAEMTTKYTYKITRDDYPDSPREWDNLGTMVCFHRRYGLGDEHDYRTPHAFLLQFLSDQEQEDWYYWAQEGVLPQDIYEKALDVFEKDHIVLDLYLYDHSILSISTHSFIGRAQHAEWDSGWIGWIYVPLEQVREEFRWKRITQKRREIIEEVLRGEVEIYDMYLRGDVWEYTIEDESGEIMGRCCGFYGREEAEREAEKTIKLLVTKEAQDDH
jgi:hypothetical protein